MTRCYTNLKGWCSNWCSIVFQDRRIELVIVDNPTINAFAVPGGVIGVHSGLFQYAMTEDEFATVIAHEIAHLKRPSPRLKWRKSRGRCR